MRQAVAIERQIAQVLVIDEELLRGERQQALERQMIVGPAIDQFASHGA